MSATISDRYVCPPVGSTIPGPGGGQAAEGPSQLLCPWLLLSSPGSQAGNIGEESPAASTARAPSLAKP
ncbi:hypothetical protein CapIbe_022595 [Capra ibex]